MHLTLTRLIALVLWANVLPPTGVKACLSDFHPWDFFSSIKKIEKVTCYILIRKGLTFPPAACKITQGVNPAIKSQL